MKRFVERPVWICSDLLRRLCPVLLILLVVAPAHAATLNVSTGSDSQINGDNLQAAISNAQCGDTIVVQAGATYSTRVTAVNSYGPQGYSFVVPNKNCPSGQFVSIQTSAVGSLPSGRVSYADIPNMATLATNSNAAAISYVRGAGWYRWTGILFTNTADMVSNRGFSPSLVDTAEAGYYPIGLWPHDIVYDRVVIRPYEESLSPVPNNVRSAAFGIRLDGANMTLQNSYVSGFCCRQSDTPTVVTQSTAVMIVGGPGPYTIVNNFLEAYGWNIFTGGGGAQPLNTATLNDATSTSATLSNVANLRVGDAITFRFALGFSSSSACNGGTTYYGSAIVDAIAGNTVTFHWFGPLGARPPRPPDVPGHAAWNGVNPSNFRITGNTLHKRAEWAANSGQCKSFWEIKSGSNVLFEANTLTGPIDAQSNTACPLNTAFAVNQDGSNPWAASNNNVFRNNLMLGVGDIFANQPYDTYCPTLPGSGMTFTNNLLGFVSGKRIAFWQNTMNGSNWTITHNTVRGNTNSLFHPSCNASSCVTSGITFRDNIVNSGGYWIQTLGASATQYPGMVQDHNVIINDTPYAPPSYAATDFVVPNVTAVGFVNVSNADAGGDYHGYALSSVSPFRGLASDSKDPGVDFAALDAALQLARSSPPPPTTLSAPSNLTVR
jgi:hypothetical protein